jgi:hypothetical protein
MAFQPVGSGQGAFSVRAPETPGQAVPGVYMLFVVDRDGVPSLGKQLRLLRTGSASRESAAGQARAKSM